MTPLKFLESFFDNALVVLIGGYTKLYSYREKAGTSFEITNETFCLVLGMLLLSGCHKLPDRKIYCETPPDIIVQAMSDLMRPDTFERILQNLHFPDNEQLHKQDKFLKLYPVIKELNKRFLKFSVNGENKSVDESMIPYYGTCNSRQQNKQQGNSSGIQHLGPCSG